MTKTPKLSVIMPSHNANPRALARILELGEYVTDGIEVVVRDNSGLFRVKEGDPAAAYTVCVPECSHMENLTEIMKLAHGEFIFMMTDDDYVLPRGIETVFEAAKAVAEMPDFVGITGWYSNEQANGSGDCRYANMLSPSVPDRVKGYLNFGGPNHLFYSAIRRSLLTSSFRFWLHDHPLKPSFVDQLCVFHWLLAGRFVDINRRLSIFDNVNWETKEKAVARDAQFLGIVGLPAYLTHLHWLMCGLDGALYANRVGQPEAGSLWFQAMLNRHVHDGRPYSNPLAEHVSAKWRNPSAKIKLNDLLGDCCEVIAQERPDLAQAYHGFWNGPAA